MQVVLFHSIYNSNKDGQEDEAQVQLALLNQFEILHEKAFREIPRRTLQLGS